MGFGVHLSTFELGQKDRPKSFKQTEFINAFQQYWKVLKSNGLRLFRTRQSSKKQRLLREKSMILKKNNNVILTIFGSL